MDQQIIVPVVSDSAILATLTTTFSKFERVDRGIASEMSRAKGAKEGTIKAHRSLFPGCNQPLKNVLSAVENVRTVHEINSTHWPPSRAVRIEFFPTHRDRVKEAINSFDLALKLFHDSYPELVQQGIKNSNGLNHPSEYMPQDEIYQRFTITLVYDQLTDANNWFRAPIEDSLKKELAEQSEKALASRIAASDDAIKTQFCSILAQARDNLLKTQNRQEGQRFSTAWLGNLQQFCEIWPGINISNDPLVTQMILDLQPVLKHTPETLKSAPGVQLQAFNTINDFIIKYDEWLNS